MDHQLSCQKHDSIASRAHCQHSSIVLLSRQHCQHNSIASTAALPALQLCQNGIYDYGSFGSYSRMAGMAGMVAKTAKAACQVWQHDSMKLGQHGSYASLAAMPARQLCQLGSYASTAAMSAQQLCYYGCFSCYMID